MTAHTQPDAILVFGEVRAILVLVLLGRVYYIQHTSSHSPDELEGFVRLRWPAGGLPGTRGGHKYVL